MKPVRAAGSASTAPSAVSLERIRGRVSAGLADFLDAETERAPDPCLLPLIEVVREFTARGKRIRPLFCYAGWVAAGGDPDETAILRVGAALELFHSFALIHDDVMDASDYRRGAPTVHRVLASRCGQGRDTTAVDSADAFGINAAILLGDACIMWSDQLLYLSGLPTDRLSAARPFIDAMRTEMIAGQYLDLDNDRVDGALDRAWRMIRYKTATYTVTRPMQIGATLAGGDESFSQRCRDFGIPLGEAFQLRDDLLGIFGDPAVTGKSALDDFRAGKLTVLMALTWQWASPEQRSTIRDLHGNPALDEQGAAQLREIIRAVEAHRAVEEMLTARASAARTALERIATTDSVHQALTDLVTMATKRDR